MASWPGSIWSPPARGTNMSDVATHTTIHDQTQAELVALETNLGTNPQGSSGTVKARIAAIEAISTSGTWTPSLTNVAIGTGGSAGVSGAYRYTNGILNVRIAITLGTSGMSVTGPPVISLPVGFTQLADQTSTFLGVGVSLTSGGVLFRGEACYTSASTITLFVLNVAGTYATRTSITNLIPNTWAANDIIVVRGVLYGTM